MKTTTQTTKTEINSATNADAFIGIDFHKRYSVYHVVDVVGKDLAKGRIEHRSPHEFAEQVGAGIGLVPSLKPR